MKRKETWRQDSPQMQIGALLGSVQGNFGHLFPDDYICSPNEKKVIERIRQQLAESQEIIRALPDTDWEVERQR